MSSVSGGVGGYFPAAAGRTYMLGGEASQIAGSPAAGNLTLYPIFLPFAVAATALGVNVTAAGAAGSTFTPVFYSCTAAGDPGVPVVTGPALDTSAIAFVSGGGARQLPAGWAWVGGLTLSAGATPTLTQVRLLGIDPRGSMVPVATPAVPAALAVQNGLAALPNPFAGTFNGASGPAVYVTT